MQGFVQVSADQLVFRIAQHILGGAVGKTDVSSGIHADDAVAGGVEQAQAVRLGGVQLAGAFVHALFQIVGQPLKFILRLVALVDAPQQFHAEPDHAQHAEQGEEKVHKGDFAAQHIVHAGHFFQRRADAEPAEHVALLVLPRRVAGQALLFGPQSVDQADALLSVRFFQAEFFLAAGPDQLLQGGRFPRVGPVIGPDGLEADQPSPAGGGFHPAFLHQPEGIGRVDAGDGDAVRQGEIAVFRRQPGIGRRAGGHGRVNAADIGHPGAQGQILADGQMGQPDGVAAGLIGEQNGKVPAGKSGQSQNAQTEGSRTQQDATAFRLGECLGWARNGHIILPAGGL